MTKILQFIGKGQVTIPQEWRALFGFGETAVKATLIGDKIVLEPLVLGDEMKWDVEVVELNQLPKEDRNLVKAGRKAYKKGQKEKFLTAAEFFKG